MASNVTQLQSSSVMKCIVWRVYIPTELKTIALQAIVAIMNIVIALFGTLANGLVIMAYCGNPRLRNVQNTIFFLLAITDFSINAFVKPIHVAAIFSILLGKCDCLLWNVSGVVGLLFLQLSLVTSVILSLQSYITLAYSYHYQTIITKSRLFITIVFSFLLVSTLTFSVFWRTYLLAYGFAVIASSAIITVVLTWCWTYKLVARHQRAIQTTQTPSSSQNIPRRKILRSTITAFFIIASLLTCYSLASFLFLADKFLNLGTLTRETFSILLSMAVTLVYFNSLLNPCLVFWRSTSFRETVETVPIC